MSEKIGTIVVMVCIGVALSELIFYLVRFL